MENVLFGEVSRRGFYQRLADARALLAAAPKPLRLVGLEVGVVGGVEALAMA